MKRPFLVWLAFAACALVGGGVLAWFTREMLRLDRESTEARQLAAVEENIRLALWRMDSALATVHGLEAARPGQEYESFYRADAAYSAGFSPLPSGTVMLPSPLLAYTPPFVRLHFQIEPDGAIRSPQAPPAELRPAALSAGVTTERLDTTVLALRDLRTRLVTSDFVASLPPMPVAPFTAPDLKDKESSEESRGQALVSKFNRQKSEADSVAVGQQAIAAPTAPAGHAPRDEASVQQFKSATEQQERANTLSSYNAYNTYGELAGSRRAPTAIPSRSAGEPDGIPVAAGVRADEQAANERESATAARALPISPSSRVVTTDRRAPVAQAAEVVKDAAPPGGVSFANTVAAKQATEPEAILTAAVNADSAEGPLLALWAGDELVFARRAMVNGREVVQGAWLDWPELQAWMLSRVSDLLPQAKLVRAEPGTAATALDAARRLAFLPVQLVPGTVRVDGRSLASPLRISIAIAWVGAAIGLGALALLLRGTVRLSERRGAFVSAVTHELRTPLTTFRMYTEMLARGMVKDEAKRQSYVETLHQESTRLSHLVENVLSYARLERGRAAARVEDTTPGELLARIEERLRQRAQQGGLTVRVEFAASIADTALRTDTTAVEQVLFNLVDNATKYGRPKQGGGEIAIAVALTKPDRLAIRVADQGPGLTAAARKRLFQPFSKSATEAAHSQPGVGLGLALCRRLARDELRGELALERTGPDGTVFRLELPIV